MLDNDVTQNLANENVGELWQIEMYIYNIYPLSFLH